MRQLTSDFFVAHQNSFSDFDTAKFGQSQNFIRLLFNYCRMSFVCKRLLSFLYLKIRNINYLFMSDTKDIEKITRVGEKMELLKNI